eukprot:6208597-Pleurochrysis_carterae.AAC.3
MISVCACSTTPAGLDDAFTHSGFSQGNSQGSRAACLDERPAVELHQRDCDCLHALDEHEEVEYALCFRDAREARHVADEERVLAHVEEADARCDALLGRRAPCLAPLPQTVAQVVQ